MVYWRKEKDEEIAEARRTEVLTKVVLFAAAAVVLALGLSIGVWLFNRVNDIFGTMLISLSLLISFVLVIIGFSGKQRLAMQIDAVMKEVRTEILSERFEGLNEKAELTTEFQFDQTLDPDYRRVRSCMKARYQGCEFYLSSMKLSKKDDDSSYSVFNGTVISVWIDQPPRKIAIRKMRTLLGDDRRYDHGSGMIKSAAEAQHEREVMAFVSEAWLDALNVSVVESRYIEDRICLDIGLEKERFFNFAHYVTEADQYIQWFRHEVNRLCHVLDIVTSAEFVKKS